MTGNERTRTRTRIRTHQTRTLGFGACLDRVYDLFDFKLNFRKKTRSLFPDHGGLGKLEREVPFSKADGTQRLLWTKQCVTRKIHLIQPTYLINAVNPILLVFRITLCHTQTNTSIIHDAPYEIFTVIDYHIYLYPCIFMDGGTRKPLRILYDTEWFWGPQRPPGPTIRKNTGV
jgi:hypothetical protein